MCVSVRMQPAFGNGRIWRTRRAPVKWSSLEYFILIWSLCQKNLTGVEKKEQLYNLGLLNTIQLGIICARVYKRD